MTIHPSFLLRTAALLLAGIAHAFAGAEPLTDPTRPPGVAPAVAAAARAASSVAAPPEAPQLRSIQLWPRGDSSALVDGRVVRVGDPLGDATVVGIDAHGVLLRRGAHDQRLALLPGAAKTIAAGPAPAFRSAVAAVTKGQP